MKQTNQKDNKNIYQKISNEQRLALLSLVSKPMKVSTAAKKLNINYSTAKTILRIFRKEKRILRKCDQKEKLLTKSKEKEFETLNTPTINTSFMRFSDMYNSFAKEYKSLIKEKEELMRNIYMDGMVINYLCNMNLDKNCINY